MSAQQPKRRMSLDARVVARGRRNALNGDQENWASDALDVIMEGYSLREVAEIMDKCVSTVRSAVYAEAFYRLCRLRGVTYVEELTQSDLPRLP